MSGERHPLGRTCSRKLLPALLLMPWALWRYWRDSR
jgi:hypothetical protein